MSALTPASAALFAALVEDSGNWSGTPLVDVSTSEKGNLTQLKRAKLLRTDDDGDGCVFAYFTEKGKALAIELNLDGHEGIEYTAG